MMDYAIRNVFDAKTGEILDAEKVFVNTQVAFQFRRDFHTNDQILRCCECHEKATVSSNSSGKVFFKHFPNTEYCDLKDESYTQAERDAIKMHIAGREGKRHITLKNEISKYLTTVDDIDASSIIVDTKYLKDAKEKRRPDVLCDFKGKKIAFEVQISPLPAKYIFKRHEFYKRNCIYLIWILDDFDRTGRNQTERDLKYLTAHQNYFFFHDSRETSTLVVQFKEGFVDEKNKCYFKWTHEFISLNDIKFDENEYQVYFKSYADEVRQAEDKCRAQELEPSLQLFRSFYLADNELWIPKIEATTDNLDYSIIQVLCKTIAPDTKLFFKCLADKGKPIFLIYLLESHWFTKNLSQKDSEGRNLFEYLFSNSTIMFKRKIEQLLFASGYTLTDSDLSFLKSVRLFRENRQDHQKRVVRALAYQRLQRIDLIKLYDLYEGTVLSILTAKHKRIIGFGLPNIISFANTAIHSYKSTWHYIERSFHFYKYWDDIITNDHNHSFQKKHYDFQKNGKPRDLDDSFLLLTKLFPDVFSSKPIDTDWFRLELLPEQ